MTQAQELRTDVLIIGGGPAGLAAAAETGSAGLRVTLVDENPHPGGQIRRQPFGGAAAAGAQLPAGVRFVGSTVCVGFDAAGDAVLDSGGRLCTARADAIVLATGAYERVLPVPGWTLPGVMTAGAAQTMMKGSGIFPYRRVVVAGTGPLLLAVTAQLIAAGAEVAAVVEAARPRVGDLRRLPALLAGGRLMIDGAGYLLRILGARVPLLVGRGVAEIVGERGVVSIALRKLRSDWSLSDGWQREVPCDAVLLSHGFSSSVDLAVQAGLRVEWDVQRQTWRPWRTERFATSNPQMFAVGDCVGVGGAQIADLEGRLAGLAIAEQLAGHAAVPRRLRRLQWRLARLEHFRRAMDELSRVPAGALSWVLPDTVVCRCQGTTASELQLAMSSGVSTAHGLKLWSRAGMGRCQGRICMPIIQELLGQADPVPPSVRFPVRPVTAGALAEARLP